MKRLKQPSVWLKEETQKLLSVSNVVARQKVMPVRAGLEMYLKSRNLAFKILGLVPPNVHADYFCHTATLFLRPLNWWNHHDFQEPLYTSEKVFSVTISECWKSYRIAHCTVHVSSPLMS
jgi:hypothetical protein